MPEDPADDGRRLDEREEAQAAAEHELIVFPDDTHESMLHSRWIYTLGRMEQFIDKHLNGGKNGLTTSSAVR